MIDDIASIDPHARSRTRPRPRPAFALWGAGAALALTVAMALGGCSGASSSEGKTLPDVDLVSLDTGKAAAWPAAGRPMVVNLWASWCAPCRKEMPAFDEVASELGDQVAIVGVTDETDREASRKAAAAADVGYPLLVDVDQQLLVDLGVSGLPGTVFVDADGTVVGRHLGAMSADELRKEIEERYGITA